MWQSLMSTSWHALMSMPSVLGPFIGLRILTPRTQTQRDIRSRCGMTFQSPDDQLFMPTLIDDVAFGPLNQRLDPAEAQARAEDAIASVGLKGLESRPAHHLSGGQKRLASLATVLSMNVKLLLMDEPGSNLDFRSRRRLMEILQARAEAIVVATHDMDIVSRLCSRVVVMDEGKIAADGPAEDILGDRSLLAAHGLA